MGNMEDGWKRLIRGLKERADGLGYISLQSTLEDLGSVAINVWVSPTNVLLYNNLPPKNFVYEAGNIKYTGVKKVRVIMYTTQSVEVGGGNQATAEITSGVNGIPCTFGIMKSSSAFGGEILQHTECTFEIENGDVLDVFVRQTSEVGGGDITILNGVYHVLIVDVL